MQIALWDWVRKHLQPNPYWVDRNGIVYELIGEAHVHCRSEELLGEGTQLCIYRASDETLYAMPRAEFHDGRFRELERTAEFPYPVM